MKTITIGLACASLLTLAACAQLGDSVSSSSSDAIYAAEVPTDEEAAEDAAQAIDASNAEQEYLKLKAEIESAGDDF